MRVGVIGLVVRGKVDEGLGLGSGLGGEGLRVRFRG